MRVWPQTDDLSGFRGQTSGRSGESPVLQLENNVTKAFLNVLEH
ncbi:hypothetical protein [Paenibacillus oceani]|nr:hypothetical protein [Paenibacillus oceani]